MTKVLSITAIVIMLGGCQMTNEMRGQVIGGAAGGLMVNHIGKGTGNVVSTAIGAVMGSMLGGTLGRDRDWQQRKRYESNSTW